MALREHAIALLGGPGSASFLHMKKHRVPYRTRSTTTLLSAACALACTFACAGSAGPDDPVTDDALVTREAAQAMLEQYLEDTQPLDHTHTWVAYDVARYGEQLAPTLLDALEQERTPSGVYHLIRVGCTMIREDKVGEPRAAEPRDTMDAARSRLRSGSREDRLSQLELRKCEPRGSRVEATPSV